MIRGRILAAGFLLSVSCTPAHAQVLPPRIQDALARAANPASVVSQRVAAGQPLARTELANAANPTSEGAAASSSGGGYAEFTDCRFVGYEMEGFGDVVPIEDPTAPGSGESFCAPDGGGLGLWTDSGFKIAWIAALFSDFLRTFFVVAGNELPPFDSGCLDAVDPTVRCVLRKHEDRHGEIRLYFENSPGINLRSVWVESIWGPLSESENGWHEWFVDTASICTGPPYSTECRAAFVNICYPFTSGGDQFVDCWQKFLIPNDPTNTVEWYAQIEPRFKALGSGTIQTERYVWID